MLDCYRGDTRPHGKVYLKSAIPRQSMTKIDQSIHNSKCRDYHYSVPNLMVEIFCQKSIYLRTGASSFFLELNFPLPPPAPLRGTSTNSSPGQEPQERLEAHLPPTTPTPLNLARLQQILPSPLFFFSKFPRGEGKSKKQTEPRMRLSQP